MLQGATLTPQFSNPIIAGFSPDPSIVRVDDDFYLVTSTFEVFPGIPVYHSRDLVNWTLIGHALHRPEQVDLDTIDSGGGVHASTIRYHDGLFYVITTNVKDGVPINFIVTASDPAGPWSNPYVLDDAPGIDPSLLFDHDGRVWYVGNRDPDDPAFPGEREIWLQQLDLERMRLTGERHGLWRGCCQGAYAEGPHVYRRDGYYYLLISEGGTAYEHALAVAISESITGPYQNNPRNPVLTHRQMSYDHPITGVGHADLVELADGRWYAVALGWRLIDGVHGILGRETFLLPVRWETERYWWKDPKLTFPVFSPGTGRVELHYPMPFPDRGQNASGELFTDFDGAILGLEWNARRTHDEPFHRLNQGQLELRLLPGAIGGRQRYAFLGIRQRHFQFEASTTMAFQPAGADEEAGLVVIQNDRAAYRLTRVGGYLRLTLSKSGRDEILAETRSEPTPVHLRVVGDYLNYRFEYSLDGERWRVLADGVDGTALSPAVMEGFNYTGVHVGLYASANGRPSTTRAAFDEFRYRPTAGDRDLWYWRQQGRR